MIINKSQPNARNKRITDSIILIFLFLVPVILETKNISLIKSLNFDITYVDDNRYYLLK